MITSDDLELMEAAKHIIKERYVDGKHHIGAAIRLMNGEIVSAVHLEAYIGRVSVCAEAIAIGIVKSHHTSAIDTIVAVRHPAEDKSNQIIRIVSPCGICRELISDLAPACNVLLEDEGVIRKVPIQTLLPFKYHRE